MYVNHTVGIMGKDSHPCGIIVGFRGGLHKAHDRLGDPIKHPPADYNMSHMSCIKMPHIFHLDL